MAYNSLKVNNVTGGLVLNGANYSNRLNINSQNINADLNVASSNKIKAEDPFEDFDTFYWVDNKYTKKILKTLQKKALSISFDKLAIIAQNYGDEFISNLSKKLAPIISTATGSFTTGGGIFSTIINTSKEAMVKFLPIDKAVTSLYTNSAQKQLNVLAEKFATQEVKRGIISVNGQSMRADILKEGGFERAAGSSKNVYNITKAGMVANGVKNGVFYFACGSLISICKHWYQSGSFTTGFTTFVKEDAKKLLAEATGATVGYIAGSAIGTAIGGLIGGVAGAYIGQKIGCFIGQLAGSVIAGFIYEHWDDVLNIGADVVKNIEGFTDYIVSSLADMAKETGTAIYNFGKSIGSSIVDGGKKLAQLWPW